MEEQRERWEREISPEMAGERLDRLLVSWLGEEPGGPSRARLQAWIREGRVELEGAPVLRPGQLVEAGQRVAVRPPPSRPEVDPADAARRLPLVHTDAHLAVADKPAGLLSHRSPGSLEAAASDLAVALLGDLPTSDGPERAGIVHRLDRETSGLLVLARTPEAMAGMQGLFRERRVEKLYLAIVHGRPRFDSDWIELPLGSDPRRPERVAIMPPGEGREARTFYEVRERFDGLALLACKPQTGRRHQIRVHLAAVGLPVVGDKLHPLRRTPDLHLPDGAPDPGRHALHATRLAFDHPVSGERLELEAPLPPELARLLDWLRR